MFNSREVPKLFSADEYKQIIQGILPIAKDHRVSKKDRDGIFSHFIRWVQDKLHIVLCMSLVGDTYFALAAECSLPSSTAAPLTGSLSVLMRPCSLLQRLSLSKKILVITP